MLIDDIKKAKIRAMKDHDKDAVSAYNTLITKITLASIEKKAANAEFSDSDALSVVLKVEKELTEERDAFVKAGRDDTVASLNRQLEVVSSYKPVMLSEQEIRDIIDTLPDKKIPFVMKYFKENYGARCDMRMLSDIMRRL